MIRVRIVSIPDHESTISRLDVVAMLPIVPRVGECLAVGPGLPIEYEVESVRWVVEPPHPMDLGAGFTLAKAVVFVRAVEGQNANVDKENGR